MTSAGRVMCILTKDGLFFFFLSLSHSQWINEKQVRTMARMCSNAHFRALYRGVPKWLTKLRDQYRAHRTRLEMYSGIDME